MKKLGLAICIIGSIIAVLYVPCKMIGIGTSWNFIMGNAGLGVKYYKFIDSTLLLVELVAINGVGLALYFFGKK